MSKRARAETPDGESSSLPFGSLERNSTLSMLENQEDEDEIDRRRDEGQLTFGEKLRAGKDANEDPSDEEAKPELTEQAGSFSGATLPAKLLITDPALSHSPYGRRG